MKKTERKLYQNLKIGLLSLFFVFLCIGIKNINVYADTSIDLSGSTIGVPEDIDVEMGKVNYITYCFTGDNCKNIEFRKLTDTEDSKLKIRILNKQVGYGYAYYTVQYFGYKEGNVLLYPYDIDTDTSWSVYTVRLKTPEIEINSCNGEEINFSFYSFSKENIDIGYYGTNETVYHGEGLSYKVSNAGGWNDIDDPYNNDKITWIYKYDCKLTLYTNGEYNALVYDGKSIEPKARLNLNIHNHIAAEAIKENEIKPTCGEAGSYDSVIYCKQCNKKLSSSTIMVNATGKHTWDNKYTIDQLPTCTGWGHQSIHCSVCGQIKSGSQELILPLGHNWGEAQITKRATCTTEGEKAYTCENCGTVKQEVISALGHDYNTEWTIDKKAGCETQGSKSHHCNRCDEKTDITAIQATGHKWSAWEVTKEASETEEGSRRRVCENDKTHVETEVIPVLAHVHKLTKVEAKKASCTEDGNKEYYVCSGCKKLFGDADATKEINKEDTVVKATGHKAEKIAGKEATCTEDGLTEGSKCSVCGEILEEQEVIKAAGHKTEKIAGKAATCTENGLTEGSKCSVCGEILKKQEVIKATGHKAEKIAGKAATCTADGLTEGSKCSVCGEILKKQEVIKATGHKWSAWEVTKEASETEEGSRRRVCENDKTHVETEVIPVLAHVHKLTKIEAKKETCTEDGNRKYYICSGCKKLFADADATKEINKEDTVVKATGHKAEKLAGKAATCTENGLTEGSKCSVCGEILKKQKVIAAIGHKSDNGTVTVQPTEDETGVKTYKCTVCGKILKEESIPALGKKDNTTTKPQTKPATQKPSIPSLKVGTKVTDKKTKAVYKVTGKNTVEYVKIASEAKSITIPTMITVNGVKCQVTSIAAKAFVNNKKLTKVVIPACVRSIGKQAFSGCKNLKTIMIKTPYLTKKSVGAKAFKGIHEKATIKVPKKQKKAYQKILKSKGIGKNVKVK